MKHTVIMDCEELDREKFSELAKSLVQMFEEHEDIITDHQEVIRILGRSEFAAPNIM